MIRISRILLIIVFCFSGILFSQNNELTVISVAGNVTVKIKDKTEKIKLGKKIPASSKIKLDINSYLALATRQNQIIELTKAGEYNAKELEAKASSGQNVLLSNLSKTVVKGVLETAGKDEKETLLGATERALVKTQVTTHMPKNRTNLSESIVNFSWFQYKPCALYTFRIMDQFENIIFEKEISDTAISLDIAEMNIKPNVYFMWGVSCKDDSYSVNKEYIKYLSADRIKAIEDSVNMIINATGDINQSPFSMLMIAGIYDNNNLFYKAMEYYEKAIASVPQAVEFRKTYANFLIKIGNYNKAYEVLRK